MSSDFEHSFDFHKIKVNGEGQTLHGTRTSIREAKKLYATWNAKRTIEVYDEAGKLIWRKEARK